MSRWYEELRRLLCSEEGQDLLEYAYLTLFVAVASIAILVALQSAIGSAYASSESAVFGLWEPPPPAPPAGS